MTIALLRELAEVAWKDAIEASGDGRFEDAAHAMQVALAIEERIEACLRQR